MSLGNLKVNSNIDNIFEVKWRVFALNGNYFILDNNENLSLSYFIPTNKYFNIDVNGDVAISYQGNNLYNFRIDQFNDITFYERKNFENFWFNSNYILNGIPYGKYIIEFIDHPVLKKPNNIIVIIDNDGIKEVTGEYIEEKVISSYRKVTSLSNIKYIECGRNHSFVINNDNTISAFGWNLYGQLGLGNNEESIISPTVVGDFDNIKQISCGFGFTLLLDNDGKVYSSGRNNYGQLGLGHFNDTNTFEQVPSLNNIIQIDSGYAHSLALDNNGNVYSFGRNNRSQLGLGYEVIDMSIAIPTKIFNLPYIKSVSCGQMHSFVVTQDYLAYGFGWNLYGQLGLNYASGMESIPIKNPFLYNINKIASGMYHTVFLLNDGTSYSSGVNYGQLGIGIKESPVLKPKKIELERLDDISCGEKHTFMIFNPHVFGDLKVIIHGPEEARWILNQ